MKRDLDLIRNLLSVIENAETETTSQNAVAVQLGLNPYDQHVQYHLRLLHEAGYVRGVGQASDGAVSVRLTWQGHEFLELSRNETAWRSAKSYVVEKTQGLTIAAVQSVLTSWSIQAVSSPETWSPLTARSTSPIPRPSRNGSSKNGRSVPVREMPSPPPTYYHRAPVYEPWDFNSHFQFHVWNGHAVETVPLYTV